MQVRNFIKKRAILNAAGILALVIAISFNLVKVLELVSMKGNIAKIEGKSLGMADPKSVNAFAVAVEKNPFGIKGARFSVIDKKTGSSTDPRGLILKGVITYRPGFAFIENKDAMQKLFKLGDEVFGAGKLTAVYADKVSISNSGGMFYLKFPVIESVTAKAPSASPGQPQKSSKEMTFDKEQIRKFLENPNELLTGARLMPVIKNGMQEGFLVKELKPGGIYETMGLQNGDIILRANNLELNSPGDGVKIFNMIKELDKMELDIIRNSVPMTQVYHIN